MNNIKIPLIAGIIIFFLVLLINVFSGNSFPVTILRSFISLIVSFGLIFGAIFVLIDVLKIDFSVSEHEEGEKEQGTENKVNIMVDDMEAADMKNEESFETGEEFRTGDMSGETEIPEKEEVISGKDNFKPDDEAPSSMEDNASNISDKEDSFEYDNQPEDFSGQVSRDEQAEQIDKKDTDSYSNASSVKDKLGIDASTEDLVKAIRTKISKDG